MNDMFRAQLASRVSAFSEALADRQARFLADLIRIRSYTGQERAAVDRTLEELRAIGCDDVWMDSAGNALGRIGRGPRVILYDAHLDTNEVADEREWPHPRSAWARPTARAALQRSSTARRSSGSSSMVG